MSDDVETLVFGDFACNELAVRLESGNDIDLLILEGLGAARLDSTAIHHERRPVHTSHGHDDTRHVLVASGDGDVRIVPLAAHDCLD